MIKNMTPINSFNAITIQYDSEQYPPPFCHRYRLEIKMESASKYTVDLNLEYYDRDEISEEEIIGEGFSMEDDFKWQGPIPEIWINELIKKINSANWKKYTSKKSTGPEFRIKISQGEKTETLSPAETRQWEIFIQEIIQAIFELANKEAPLLIRFVSKPAKDLFDQVDFMYSFAQRNLSIDTENKSHMKITWAEGQKLLKYIFGIDYLPENALEKVPKSKGNYISPGDGLWYELSPEKQTSDGEAEKLERLIETFNQFA